MKRATKHATTAATPAPVLSIRGLHKSFGRTQVLCGVDLTLTAGERLAIIGPNGAGKSTLFDVITGRTHADKGRVLLHDRDVTGRAPHVISRRGLSRSFQTSQLFGHMSVIDHLRCAGLWPSGHRYTFWRRMRGLDDVTRRSEAWLARLGLEARRDVPAGALSYAEQRVLEVGMCAASAGSVMLLDEPTAGMSQSESARMVALIAELSRGRALLMIEHDMRVVFSLADRIAVLARGAVIACDTPERIRRHPDVRTAYLGEYADALGPAGAGEARDA
ncbi:MULTISPECIES: ABC transporter ATP-binding protein [Pandoraea]|uniref:ABC transporter ATP-binding protein n=1 Tax=Pandoraea TaxID=93217 RepID=UPI0003D1C9AF|nr:MULTISPECIES: ABC transporter ATP-binding protein [Pandoraea]AHB78181.1 ABC transporter ATP-binding protein [Pandoraea pnomenusa]MBN9095816.1 ABC transporter ATP-binding protein [Pandoraea pnomenusa]QDH60084.1 ABC transporter ATP-binding protein [Pandoraea pnomenusa]